MFAGVLALLERSLRLDARALGSHLLRLGLVVAIYVAICLTTMTRFSFGAPGLRFFQNIVYLNLAFITLAGVSFFATSISEEKEEDTLGLMLMAGISPLGILLGKSSGRLVQALLLLAVQYPFTQLAVTLGGVNYLQVRAAMASLTAYAAMLAGVGLFCSTVASRNRTASFLMVLCLIANFLLPGFCHWYIVNVPMSTMSLDLFQEVKRTSVFLQLTSILSSVGDEPIIGIQVVSNAVVGVVGFLLAWASFGVVTSRPTTESAPRVLLSRQRGAFRPFSPGRPRLDPLVWKDFHFVAGGLAATLLRLAFCVVLYLGVMLLFNLGILNLRWGPGSWYSVTGSYLTVLMFAITFDAGLLLSRSLHEEVRGQTLTALMMLPKSTGMILYPKAIGTLLGWLPGPACLVLGILLLPEGWVCASDFFRRPGPPYLFISFFVLAPHLAALSALYVRWGAVSVGIGLTVGLAFLTAVVISLCRIGPEDASVFVLGSVILGFSLVCHLAIWLRAETLAVR